MVFKLYSFLGSENSGNLKVVCILSNRLHMDVCFLAAQLSGACLVPISPRLPESRRLQILNQVNPDLILTEKNLLDILTGADSKTVPIVTVVNPNNLFSMMMTSGSTGISKIVGISYANWNSFFEQILKIYPMSAGEKIVQTFEPVFDPYYAIAAMSYHQGAHIYHLQENDIYNIFLFCNKNEIEFWASVPSLVDLSLSRESTPEKNSTIRRSIFTGEKLRFDIVKKWADFAPDSTIENLYGPVETTVWVSRAVINPQNANDPLPIGLPFHSVQLKLEDGLLVIEGSQVGYGYFDQSEWKLFNRRFETQDICGLDAAGNFIFKGRRDQEIKVAGQRIDVNSMEIEIEKVLQAGCILQWQTEGFYFLAITQIEVDFNVAFELLSPVIPVAFIPKKWICLKEWPRTASGKWDRAKIQEQALGILKVAL